MRNLFDTRTRDTGVGLWDGDTWERITEKDIYFSRGVVRLIGDKFTKTNVSF